MNKTSSPGIPYCKEAPSNGKWLKWNGLSADEYQLERLWNHVNQVFEGTYQHRFRVFVKPELHSEKKAREQRWRLISASSLPVQIAWQMTFGILNSKIIDTPYQTPSFQGYVAPGGGWKQLRAFLKSKKMRKCIDKSAWDINAPGWVFFSILKLRTALCVNVTPEWERIAMSLYIDAYRNSILVFPNGDVYQQLFSGFMKSGIVSTISDNSKAQILLHIAACLRLKIPITPIVATGDDTVQQVVTDAYIVELEKLGCRVKEVVDGYQFMGFDHENFLPIYPHKHIANIQAQQEEFAAETIDSYLHLYVHHPNYELWRELANKLNYPVRSRFEHQFWLDDPRAFDDY